MLTLCGSHEEEHSHRSAHSAQTCDGLRAKSAVARHRVGERAV
jgi:hypothetical protein